MKNRLIIVFLSFFVCSYILYAANSEQVYQQATLKNGTVLYGFIQQNDGLGTLTFHSDSAIVYGECGGRLLRPDGAKGAGGGAMARLG